MWGTDPLLRKSILSVPASTIVFGEHVILVGLTLRLISGRRALPYGPYLSLAAVIVLLTWKWLWEATKVIFGHWPTLLGLVCAVIAGMALLLGLLRMYRAIPVETRHGGGATERSAEQSEFDTGSRQGEGETRRQGEKS